MFLSENQAKQVQYMKVLSNRFGFVSTYNFSTSAGIHQSSFAILRGGQSHHKLLFWKQEKYQYQLPILLSLPCVWRRDHTDNFPSCTRRHGGDITHPSKLPSNQLVSIPPTVRLLDFTFWHRSFQQHFYSRLPYLWDSCYIYL